MRKRTILTTVTELAAGVVLGQLTVSGQLTKTPSAYAETQSVQPVYQPVKPEAETLGYRIRPIPTADRTKLEITLQFSTLNNRPETVKLPTDFYGTPDLHRFVTSFEGEAGTTVQSGKSATERIVTPSPTGEARVKYILSYDPKEMDGISFGPNVGPTHFYCAGCQWMLRVGDASVERRHVVEIVDLPKSWHAYSSLGPDTNRLEIKAPYEDMIATAIGGGAGETDRFTVRTKSVSVYVEGEFAIPRAKIFAAVKRIVTLEREWFADFDHPFYAVTVLPRSGIIAGTCIRNLFVCFAKPDVTRDELNVLVAHEMFHTWLPNKATIALAKGESELRYEWFYEGFTDYFARKILAEAELLSPEKFADLVNQDIYNLADNPARGNTFADLLAAMKVGKYTTAYKKLAYYRGALIAIKWESKVRDTGRGRTLADFIRDLYRLATKSRGKVTEQAFFDLATTYGIDAKVDLERYVIRGEPITLPPDALVGRFELRDAEVPAFDPGFSIVETFKARKVVGVVEKGPAARAGLRDGMELVGIQNSNRFGNGWRADRPLIVTVRIDGRETPFEFFPHGSSLRLKLFVAKGGE